MAFGMVYYDEYTSKTIYQVQVTLFKEHMKKKKISNSFVLDTICLKEMHLNPKSYFQNGQNMHYYIQTIFYVRQLFRFVVYFVHKFICNQIYARSFICTFFLSLFAHLFLICFFFRIGPFCAIHYSVCLCVLARVHCIVVVVVLYYMQLSLKCDNIQQRTNSNVTAINM